MSYEFGSNRPVPEVDKAIEYYRKVFEGDEDLDGDYPYKMEVGDSGWCAYWAVEVDSNGRHWLGPLFRVEQGPFDSAVYIFRDRHGFTADFSGRVVDGRDRFYDQVVQAENVDSIEDGRFYGIPVSAVIGYREQLPGYFCDENG